MNRIQTNLSILLVVLDTLYASLQIQDGGNLFRYSRASRESALQEIDKAIRSIGIELDFEK